METKENLINTKTKYREVRVTESKISDLVGSLDASGWIIKQTGQFVEKQGVLIRLIGEAGQDEATAVVAPAEFSQFQKITQIEPEALKKSIYISSIWVGVNAKISGVLPAILYFALRYGRILGRQHVVTLIPIPNPLEPIATMMHLNKLSQLDTLTISKDKLLPMAQHLNYSMHQLYEICEKDYLQLINNGFSEEILSIHRHWLNRFYQGAWCQAIVNGTLTKEQYIYSLFNLHQYVRQTTRLAARCVAHSEDLPLRNHYINHFNGEINHELIIESDLKALGADIDYLKTKHVPHPATKEFMMVQESTIGYYQDPVLMLACPLAAEGVAAHMSAEFLNKLFMLIASWGIKEPKKAARFFSSHIHTDGGGDGHWINVVKIMQRYIQNENTQQKFLSVLTAAMNGFEHGFNANVNDLSLWSAVNNKKEK